MAVGYHEEVKERRQEEIRKKFDACWKEMDEEVPQVLFKNMQAIKTYFLIFKDGLNFGQGFKLVYVLFLLLFADGITPLVVFVVIFSLAAHLVAFWQITA